MVRMQSNPAEFQRLRMRTEALMLSEADKRGPLLVEMDRTHVRQVTKAYTTEGASTGRAWERLSPGYAKWKRRHFPGRKILVLTRDTRERFTQPTNAAHIREFKTPFTYIFGALSEKQWRHETGTGTGRQRLPVRSVLTKTQADYAAFVTTLRVFYQKRVRQVLRHL